MDIIDISLPLYEGMITYPNNPPFHINLMSTGHSRISKIQMGSHTGTHYDFPNHAIENGMSSNDFALTRFFQECQVIDLSHCDKCVDVKDLKEKNINKKIVLIKTNNSLLGYRNFNKDFIYLTEDASIHLANYNLDIVGIDYLSVKGIGVKGNGAHINMLSHNVLILEGINLQNVSEGNYFFSGAPLYINNSDGAPARVLLINNL